MTDRFAVVPAAYLYLVAGGRVLLQQRRNTGYMDGHWVAGAAGHVELHETAAACAIREAAEELGIDVRADDLSPVTVMQRTNGTDDPIEQRVDWFFTATRWSGEPQVREPAKCAGLGWFDLADLPTPMPSYEVQVLTGVAAASIPAFTQYGF